VNSGEPLPGPAGDLCDCVVSNVFLVRWIMTRSKSYWLQQFSCGIGRCYYFYCKGAFASANFSICI
jgi:hypothetical protein